MPIDVTAAPDLRSVYMFVYDNFACSTSDVADGIKHINLRYARELLGTLQHAGLIVITESDEGDVWQAFPDTYDTMTSEEAAERIDKWLGVQAPPDPQNATSTPSRSSLKSDAKGPHPCNCGCGETITTKAVYKPGHDARHAGVVGREIAANYETKGFDRRELLAALPSDALKAKAERIAEKATEKATRKASKPEPVKDVEGTVKVGKGEFVAKRGPAGTVMYMDGKGEWKPASKTAAKTFQEG